MKILRTAIFCLTALLLSATLLSAQDFSKYRGFTLGSTLATVLKRTDQKLADVNATHPGPPLFQELTWWPPNIPGAQYRSDSVEQVLFSFYNGALYKIVVTYDQGSTQGLTSDDLIKSLAATYGPATSVVAPVAPSATESYSLKQTDVATWESADYSVILTRSSFTNHFGLVLSSKALSAQADLAAAKSAKQEVEDGPKREAAQKKKDADELEALRLKNQKIFHP